MPSTSAQLFTQLDIVLKAIEQIKLAVFCSLAKKLRVTHESDSATALAACIVHKIFLEAHSEPSFIVFLRGNRDLISAEMQKAFSNEKLARAVATAYAARFILLGYESGISPFDETNRLLELAERFDLTVHNIIKLWGGPEANFDTAVTNLGLYAETLEVDT